MRTALTKTAVSNNRSSARKNFKLRLNTVMFSQFIDKIFSAVSSIPFDTLIWIIWGSFAGIFVLSVIACMFSSKIRAASKRPYMCLTNAYSALTLAAFLTANEFPQAVLATTMFWCAGYVTYGVLCSLTKPLPEPPLTTQIALTSIPSAAQPVPVPMQVKPLRTEMPVAKSSVKLEHAISVTDKLLKKNLGKTDRQELEKLKNTLAVLQMKGTLTPAESDILNENFNALLKLMAKYNM